MFESFSNTRKRSGSVAHGLKYTAVALSEHKETGVKRITIHIPPKVVKASGLKAGDRLDVLFSREDRQVRFQKADGADGWKLGHNKGSDNLRITITLFDGFITPRHGEKIAYLKTPFIKKGQITYDMPENLGFYSEE